MNRRDLLSGAVAAAALAPLRATAQSGLPVIGYLSSRSAEAEIPVWTGFLNGLKQAGFIVGQNVVIGTDTPREASIVCRLPRPS